MSVGMMQKTIFYAMMALAVFITASCTVPGQVRAQPSVLILSSTQSQEPMQYVDEVTTDLKQAGYSVTFMSDSNISLNEITTLLDQYDIFIWRTSTYEIGNITYWYLGRPANETALAAYGTSPTRSVDVSNGMVAVSSDFFTINYGPRSLGHVKLAILSASMTITLAQDLIAAGVGTTIDFYNTVVAPSTEFDYITWSLIGYLTSGNSVSESVTKTLYYFQYLSSLDPNYVPPISFLGNGNLQIIG